MLIVNGLIVREVYGFVAQIGPAFLRHARVVQVVSFFLPVLLIFVEWWLVDWWTDRWHRRRRARESQDSAS